MPVEIYNPNPTVFSASESKRVDPLETQIWALQDEASDSTDDSDEVEPIDQAEVFDLIRLIHDPEHPYTLEELRVVSAPQITILDNRVAVEFTPTQPHCGASTIIGLSIRVRLMRSLPNRFKVDIFVKPGSHQSEHAVNKQLNDKERVAAALENPTLVDTLEQCLANAGRRGKAAD